MLPLTAVGQNRLVGIPDPGLAILSSHKAEPKPSRIAPNHVILDRHRGIGIPQEVDFHVGIIDGRETDAIIVGILA